MNDKLYVKKKISRPCRALWTAKKRGKKRAACDGSANQVRKSILHERKKPVIFRAGRLSDLACN